MVKKNTNSTKSHVDRRARKWDRDKAMGWQSPWVLAADYQRCDDTGAILFAQHVHE
jgi:hypothetical protein